MIKKTFPTKGTIPPSSGRSPLHGTDRHIDGTGKVYVDGKLVGHAVDWKVTFHDDPLKNVTYNLDDLKLNCQHEYKTYHGFTESYEYCVKCDHKKGQ